ncbi:MAG: 3'-5' exonuclease, partial [Opitutaceae bacterium]
VLLARDPDPDETVAAGEAEEGERMAGQAAAIRDALERIRPLERGLSCAILVRRGANAQAVAAWLRTHGVAQVMVEGDCALAEQSPVVAAIVDALRWLLSPGHRFGFGHASLTPLGDLLREPLAGQGEATDSALWRHWTARVAAEGAAAVTSRWCAQLAATEPDAHVRFCLGHLDELARGAGRGLELSEWLEAVRRLTVRETAARGTIHVMTIHKAKGLGFDVVFLPDLDLGAGSPPPFLMLRDAEGRPAGCVAHPPKWLRGWLPDLEKAAETEEAVRQHEALCVLYVALTRAKEATFVIMRETARGRKADARDWVLEGLGIGSARSSEVEADGPWGASVLAWERGSREFAEVLEREGGVSQGEPALTLLPAEPRRRRMRPSDAGHSSGSRSTVPVAAIAAATDYGTAVHKVFEQVEWLGQELALSGVESAVADVRACLDLPEVAALFRAESPRDEALRELPIEFTDAGEWWSGVIDRLVLRRDESGGVREALIIDFKTDQVETADALRERHAGQLAAYLRAVGTALKLPPEKIRTVLVSTRLRCVVAV